MTLFVHIFTSFFRSLCVVLCDSFLVFLNDFMVAVVVSVIRGVRMVCVCVCVCVCVLCSFFGV